MDSFWSWFWLLIWWFVFFAYLVILFQILTDLFGEEYAFTDHTHDARGLAPRTFASFNDAAEEAAISRLYGGIHYRAAIVNGVMQGRLIAAEIAALTFHAGS
jgi:hypothetical protein